MIKQANFKRALTEALPNFKTDKVFSVMATNATLDYALIRSQELIGEARSAADKEGSEFDDRILRAIQLLTIARLRRAGSDSTAV